MLHCHIPLQVLEVPEGSLCCVTLTASVNNVVRETLTRVRFVQSSVDVGLLGGTFIFPLGQL